MRFDLNQNQILFIGLLFSALISGCQKGTTSLTVTVSNPLNQERKSETISLPVKALEKVTNLYGADNVLVKDKNGQVLVSQAVDADENGSIDEILFQTDINGREEKEFFLSAVQNAETQRPQSPVTTYSRFVPERTDDYTWENDRVAFRTYGPVAQKMVEKNIAGGTLTSGMDGWLKRVNYSVIDKWYKNDLAKIASYHVDHGEGYDPYHVGVSRGMGGIGVWDNDKLHVSKNFISYKKLANGPIRTLFELTYAPWSANGRTVQEKKNISLDLGSNLTRYEVDLAGSQQLPNITIGITLHDKKGEVKDEKQAGWFRYWEPMDDAFLGTGIVVAPTLVQDFKDYRVTQPDQSHLLVITRPEKNKLVYYAGFGWTKSGQFKSAAEWDQYLADFATRQSHPLQTKIK